MVSKYLNGPIYGWIEATHNQNMLVKYRILSYTYTSAEYVGTLRKPTLTEHLVKFTIDLESIPAA